MSDSFWRLVEIRVPTDMVDAVSDRLWTMGCQAVEEVHLSDGPLNIVALRTSLGSDPLRAMERLRREFPSVSVAEALVPRADSDRWRDFAGATWISPDIAVVPAWLESPAAKLVVRVEPMDLFGLGDHPTTVLAGQLILEHVTSRDRVLDVGCGSGVLSLLALLGCGASCVATDIAPGTTEVLGLNCVINGRDPAEIQWVEELDEVHDGSVDVVVANILAPVLREFAPQFDRVVGAHGSIILSGLLETQTASVLEAFGGFRTTDVRHSDVGNHGRWCAMVLQRVQRAEIGPDEPDPPRKCCEP